MDSRGHLVVHDGGNIIRNLTKNSQGSAEESGLMYSFFYLQGVHPLVKVKFKDFSRIFKALFQ